MDNYYDKIDPIGESFEPEHDDQEESIAEQIFEHAMAINGTLTWIDHVVEEMNTTINDFKTYSDDVLMAEKLTKYANILNDRSKNILAHSNKIQDLTQNI